MSEILSKSIRNMFNDNPSNTHRELSTKTSTINFENNVKVSKVGIIYAYSQSGYSGGNGSIIESTLKFYDKNNNLLYSIVPTRIYDISSHNESEYKTYEVNVNIEKVRKVILTSNGYNVGGYSFHDATIYYQNDLTNINEKFKKAVLDTIQNNKFMKKIVTAKIEEE